VSITASKDIKAVLEASKILLSLPLGPRKIFLLGGKGSFLSMEV
jgi:hypothetical protein